MSIRSSVSALVVLALAVSFGAAHAADPAPARSFESDTTQEHLPKRAKPPAPGMRPKALPAYGQRLGVPARSDADRQFDQLVDEFLLVYLANQPVRATNIGVHDYDAMMPATDRAGIEASIASYRGFLARFEKLDATGLGRERRFDHAMLTSRLQGTLLDLETIQNWKRDPNYYLSIASGSIHALLKRDFAPLEERGWNVVARINQIGRVFRDAKANLENPPRIYTEIAIAQAKGAVRFFSDLVPEEMKSIKDPILREEFDHHLAQATGAANEFYDWLKSDLLPRSKGEFALGPDTYAKKLQYDEMVATPIDSLYRRGEIALHETQREMEKEANAIRPGLSVSGALAEMAKDAPSSRDLVPTTQAGLQVIRRYVADHGILTPPAREDLRVVETPVFQRSLSFASMDSPGVLETKATEAYYNVTPADSTWPADRQAEHLGFYNKHQLEVVSIHEALPGHYYQFLALKKCPSLVRALFGPGSNSEGWAHYCEQMMLEEGYGAGDHRTRLAQLNMALQRICRYQVGIALHTRGMTYDDAVAFFEREGFMATVNAEREARRGTSDPTYLVYTLGKWQILDLRDEVRKREGSKFRLKAFHDRFLSYGRAPVALIRDDWMRAGTPMP